MDGVDEGPEKFGLLSSFPSSNKSIVMAQFDISKLFFPIPPGGGFPAQLGVCIDNPEGLVLEYVDHGVPPDVEVVSPGGHPTQEFWVYAEDYHLTIGLTPGAGEEVLVVEDTGYYNIGEKARPLDIIIVQWDSVEGAQTVATGRKQLIVYRD